MSGQRTWFIRGSVGGSAPIKTITIDVECFQVGRKPDLPLCLNQSGISRVHAALLQKNDSLLVKDLQSTNGTFVNGVRIDEETQLQEGDVVAFGNLSFQVGRQGIAPDAQESWARMDLLSLGSYQTFADHNLEPLIEALDQHDSAKSAAIALTSIGHQVAMRHRNEPVAPEFQTDLNVLHKTLDRIHNDQRLNHRPFTSIALERLNQIVAVAAS